MFKTTVTIEWGDCDEAGIVFYPNYFYWLDCAFQRLLRARGLSQRELRKRFGAVTPIVQAHCDFKAPARYDDVLDIDVDDRSRRRAALPCRLSFPLEWQDDRHRPRDSRLGSRRCQRQHRERARRRGIPGAGAHFAVRRCGLISNMKKRSKKPSSAVAKSPVDKAAPGTSAQSASRRSRGIQSVDIGFRVLAALAAEPEAATLGTIAKRAELSPSQTHRYLSSLIASGMAHQHPASGRYELGPQAIQIGLAALARTDIFAEADPAIAAFTRDTGRTTLLAARGPLGPTIVRWHFGRRPVVTSLSVGSVLPLLNSATGFAFLAFMNDDEVAGTHRGRRRSAAIH